MGLLDKKEQYKKILDYVDRECERISLLWIRKWVKLKDIVKYMQRHGLSENLIRLRLNELVDKKQLQTKTWGGMRFYAPPVIPLPFIVAALCVPVLAVIFYPVTGYPINLGSIFIILSPIYVSFIWYFVDKKVKGIGVCLVCGRTIQSGDFYCGNCEKLNKTVVRECQICGKPFKTKASSNEKFCEEHRKAMEKIKGK